MSHCKFGITQRTLPNNLSECRKGGREGGREEGREGGREGGRRYLCIVLVVAAEQSLLPHQVSHGPRVDTSGGTTLCICLDKNIYELIYVYVCERKKPREICEKEVIFMQVLEGVRCSLLVFPLPLSLPPCLTLAQSS